MLLIDLNQVILSGILTQIKPSQKLEEDLLRHIILNTLRSNIKKFKEYGDVVLCCDSKNYWRRSVFPHYKAHRKDAREKSSLDWNTIFKVLNQIKVDLKEHFPYRVIEVDGAEADDIIGVLTPRISSSEKVLIVSSDADFKQLQKYDNVKQYNPMLNVFVKSLNPQKELKEKIIRGDKGDGIVNILSNDDAFVMKVRQKPISSSKLNEWLEKDPKECFSEEIYRNFKRNQILIDFDHIPTDLRSKISHSFDQAESNPRNKLYKYLVSNRLMSLLDVIEDF